MPDASDGAAPVAAIDIGTNSFHLVVARPTGNNRFEILDREKEVVRLGSGSGDMKELSQDAIGRGVAALSRFRLIADSFGAEIHAVATSAVREAENRREFLDAALAGAGVRVHVISGVEEARLIHLGVLQAVPVFDQQVLVIDIGGGSTEFVVGRGEDVFDARSLKIGAIRITERFFAKEPVKKKAVAEARTFIRSYLLPVKRMVSEHGGFQVAVGSSGTILNVAEMVRARQGAEPRRQLGNTTLTAGELGEVVDDLASRPKVADRLSVPGLDPRRADIILGGVLVLDEVVRALRIEELLMSDFALREGVLLDVLRRRHAGTLGHLRDLRYESVQHLAALTPGEKEHCERIASLAVQLFEATRPLHKLPEHCEEWLEAAALLCNVGLVISHDRHHLHSYYVIRNTELLTGFTDHEIELIALVARYHRKSAPKSRHPEYARLGPEEQRLVRILAGLVRIAAGLDRTRSGAVRAVRVNGTGGRDGLRIVVDTAPGADAELEIYSARSRQDLLAEALGVALEIEPAAN
ncbi:MAG TPA: Ppx/GppA phosphatase family protein [Acidimicrobiia bacterium]|nr:Ppx/GppA phosphatase family protein [Acidimicrobiia bacterium]